MKRALLATTMLVCAAGAASAQTCSVPGPAAAAGYSQQTFGGPLNLGTTPNASTSYPVIGGGVNIVPDTFFGQSWQSIGASGANGSVTLNGAGETYGDGLSTAEVTPAGQPLQGIAFGGGGYFQITMAGNGPMSFWMNDAETMNGLSNGSGSGNSWIEADIAEFDSTNAYGFTLHNWYGTPGSGNVVNANENGASPAGANYTQPNTYGMLWVPATATTQGQVEFFFNGQQVGNTITWNQYVPGQSATANPFAVLDSLHMVPILGANPGTTVTFSDLQVWQASNANDIGTQVAADAAAAPCNGGAVVTTPAASTSTLASTSAPAPAPANAPAEAAQPVAALPNDPTPGEGSATDCQGNVWTVNSNNKILENGVSVVGGGDTSNLVVQGCTVMGKSNGQNGSSTNWFTLNSVSPTTTDGWTVSAAPALAITDALPQTTSPTQAATVAPTPAIPAPAVCGSSVPSGAFHVAGGQIIGPDGKSWIARGIDLHSDNLAAAAAQLPSQFSGVNLVRVASGDYESLPDPASMAAAVTSLTSRGTVVEFTDYGNSLGTGSGGGQGTIYTGSLLAVESNWYAAMASYYRNNPYVWFGTNNEPSLIYPGNSNAVATGPQSLSAWQKATYDAVRGTGNTNPVLLEPGGDAVGNYRGGDGIPMMAFQDPSVVATMTNVIWDPHIYGFMDNYAMDDATNNALVSGVVAAVQAVPSADGVVPAIIGEYGPEGANGTQLVTAVIDAGANGQTGSAAWVWDQDGVVGGPTNDPTNAPYGLLAGGQMTTYGQMVQLYINTSVQPCSTAEANTNANATLTAISAQVTGTPTGTDAAPTAAPVSPITATLPDTSTATDPDAAAIAQANAIITAAQAQLTASQ
jgi:hypothetical protein